jgi:hypothetical protein
MAQFRINMTWQVDALVEGASDRDIATRLAKGVGDLLQSMGAAESEGTVLMQGQIDEVHNNKGRDDFSPPKVYDN